jgi:hypothetical protein
VMSSEIAGLEDLHSFLKLGNNVTRFSFPHMDRPLIAPSFVPREIPESDMWLNPLAPNPVVKPSAQAPAVQVPAVPAATAEGAVNAKPATQNPLPAPAQVAKKPAAAKPPVPNSQPVKPSGTAAQPAKPAAYPLQNPPAL